MTYKLAVFLGLSISLLTHIIPSTDNSAWAQGGRNENKSIVLDFQVNNDTIADSTIETTPVFQNVTVDGVERKRFTATLVLQDAVDLIGFNTDLVFDKNVLNVVSIREVQSDVNFDGRSNIADVLTLGERLGSPTTSDGLSYFERASAGASQNVIDAADVAEVQAQVQADLNNLDPSSDLFWTSNPDTDLTTVRESVEIFEDPAISNANGRIDDIVVVLLPRNHPNGGFPADFGFDGDARIAEITFEVVGSTATTTSISFEDSMAIDEGTSITTTSIDLESTTFTAPAITVPLQ